jgi:molybdopterin biosynthesis enzyme
MKHTDKEVKDYLLWWVLNLGQGMIHVEDVKWVDAEKTYSIFKQCQRRKFIRVRLTKDRSGEDAVVTYMKQRGLDYLAGRIK